MTADRHGGSSSATIGVRFRHRKEKLPAFKMRSHASYGHALKISRLNNGKRRIRQNIYALLAKFCIYIIMNTPQPSGKILLIALYRVLCHVFRQTFATELAGKNIGNGIEKLANSRGDFGRKADKMK
jgi:hypothetical protein